MEKITDAEVIKELQSASEWFAEHGRNTNTAIIGICNRAIDLINRQKEEKEHLEYVLMAVMHHVDKWLEGDELKQDEANRACTMREKTLKITEKLHKKIDGLQKANQESFVAIEKRKAENERLNKLVAEKQIIIDELSAIITDTCEDCKVKLDADKAKSEAYKEFAEKLHDNFISKVQKKYCRLSNEHSYKWTEGFTVDDVLSNIDNALKELQDPSGRLTSGETQKHQVGVRR